MVDLEGKLRDPERRLEGKVDFNRIDLVAKIEQVRSELTARIEQVKVELISRIHNDAAKHAGEFVLVKWISGVGLSLGVAKTIRLFFFKAM